MDLHSWLQLHFGFTSQVDIHNLVLIVANVKFLMAPDVVSLSALINFTNNS